MSSRTLGIIIVLCALLVGAIAAWKFTQPNRDGYQARAIEAPGNGVVGKVGVDNDPFDVEIAYTDTGYATTSITIKKGTRVRFVNNSSKEEWPASGIHPTHTLYPEKQESDCLGSSFDSCASLKPGEFFDYTFNYVGSWPFHDHLHGYDSGTIIVE